MLFVGMDALFKGLVLPAFFQLSTMAVDRAALRTGVAFAVCGTAVWWAIVVASLAPLARWNQGYRDRAAVERTARAVQSMPMRLGLLFSGEWLAFAGALVVRSGQSLSWPLVFFLAAMTLGPFPLAHSLSVWVSAPTMRSVSIAARAMEGRLPVSSTSLSARIAMYCLAIGLAPTFYMAAMASSGRTRGFEVDGSTISIGVFVVAIVAFSGLCATLLSTTITRPLAEMTAMIHRIGQQGAVASVEALPIYRRDEVGSLADVANTMVDRLALAESERAAATESLRELNETLENRIAERTRELAERAEAMRLVLDNVEQALCTIDREGFLSSEHSRALVDWFGAPADGETFHAFFGRRSPSFAIEASIGWEQVTDGSLPMEVALDQLPATLATNGRTYRFEYEPIGTGEVEHVLVVVTDVTAEIETERLRRDRSESLALFDRVLADRSGLASFLEDADGQIALATASHADVLATKRALHTLKGNAALLELDSLVEICHQIESEMAERPGPPEARSIERLTERWARVRTEIVRLLGDRRRIEISEEEHRAIGHALVRGAPRGLVARMVHDLSLEPVQARLAHFAEQAERLGKRLDKPVSTRIVHNGVRLDGRHWTKFWSTFVHAVRNAVDHGIESPEERVAAGKPAEGTLTLTATRATDGILIAIEDDGRGISWDALRRSAVARGVVASTDADVKEALFAVGVSTAERVTDLSGRGIGMGALRCAVEDLGGTLEVTSEAGRGTRVSAFFPMSRRTAA